MLGRASPLIRPKRRAGNEGLEQRERAGLGRTPSSPISWPRLAARLCMRTRGSLEKYGLRSALSGFARRSRRRATGSVGSSGRRSRTRPLKIPFCASLVMRRLTYALVPKWLGRREVTSSRGPIGKMSGSHICGLCRAQRKANGARSGNCACSPRLRRVSASWSFTSRCTRLWTPRASLNGTSLWSGSGSGAAESAFLLNRLAVSHPNRASEIIPLFSGNCTRWTRNSTSREVDAAMGVSHGVHATATGARSSASTSAVRATAAS
jgi:hypothetical protein